MSDSVLCNATRPGTEKQVLLPTVSPSSISCGTIELKILRHMFQNKNSRFNIRGFNRGTGIPRTTINDALKRLISKELVDKPHDGNHMLTSKGFTFIEVQNGRSDDSRRGCRGVENLSQHYTRFEVVIGDRSGFSEDKLSLLKALDWKSLRLHNLHQYYVYFSDATLIINPKRVIIRVHDLVSVDSEETLLLSFNKALGYSSRLRSIGILGVSLSLDNVHFARVKSVFAEFLERVDNRFFTDLGDGRKFWIDFSNDKQEDETNDAELRVRLDEFIKDLAVSKSTFSDVDKMKEVLGQIVQLEVARFSKKLGDEKNG